MAGSQPPSDFDLHIYMDLMRAFSLTFVHDWNRKLQDSRRVILFKHETTKNSQSLLKSFIKWLEYTRGAQRAARWLKVSPPLFRLCSDTSTKSDFIRGCCSGYARAKESTESCCCWHGTTPGLLFQPCSASAVERMCVSS